jgi:hypothetical protein
MNWTPVIALFWRRPNARYPEVQIRLNLSVCIYLFAPAETDSTITL